MWCFYSSDDDDKEVDSNIEENVSIEDLVPMDSINVGTRDCSCEDDDLDVQPVVELQSESRDNTQQKVSVNGISYKKLLENEEAENEKIASNEVDVVMSPVRKSKLTFREKLEEVRDHAYSSLQVFMSLLKYARFNNHHLL